MTGEVKVGEYYKFRDRQYFSPLLSLMGLMGSFASLGPIVKIKSINEDSSLAKVVVDIMHRDMPVIEENMTVSVANLEPVDQEVVDATKARWAKVLSDF